MIDAFEVRERVLWAIQPGLDQWLERSLPCSKKNFSLVNPHTEFFSYCFTALIEAGLSILFVVPLFVTIITLATHERPHFTIRGHVCYLLALLAPTLRLLTFWWIEETPSSSEIVTIVVGYVVALTQYIQDGRVRVCSSDVLLYWAAFVFTTLSIALDAFLRHKIWLPYVAQFCLALLVFLLELFSGPTKSVSFDSITIFDKITLDFMNPLLEKGCKTQVVRADFPETPKGLNSVTTHEHLKNRLDTYPEHGKYRLIIAMFATVRPDIAMLVVTDVLAELLTYCRPLVLAYFLNSLQKYYDGEVPLYYAIYFAVFVGVMPLSVVALQNIYQLIDSHIDIISRTSLTGLIYRKSLRLSPKSREEYDSAKIMNLLNVDTDMVYGVAGQLPTLVSAPVALVLATWQLYAFIGTTMFVAIPLYLVFIAFSSFASKWLYSYFPTMMKIRDKRTKATTDAVRNIKSLKLYAWEKPFYEKIETIRNDEEMVLQGKTMQLMAALSSIWTVTGDIVATAIFITFLYLQKGTLSPAIVFPCLSLLSYITVPFMALPNAVTALGRALTSQGRINELLLQDEISYKNYYHMPAVVGYDDIAAKADNATVSWNGDADQHATALKNVSFEAYNGDLICITGRVGSGKTALLKSLCGELCVDEGSILVKGEIAYCPQEPWLQNKTIKENILFGKKWDENFYNTTLEACDLTRDIAGLPDKDETEVGERGVSLSGGQKARVALARAIYSRADLFILDDVLSAVDEHVSTHLIQKIFSKQGLIASKTIILATNNVKVLSHASKIIALNDKTISEQVTLQEVLKTKDQSLTYRLMKEFHVGGDIDNIEVADRRKHVSESGTTTPLRRASVDEGLDDKPITGQSEEDEDKGTVSLSIFTRYFEAAGRSALVFCMIIMVLSVVITNSLSIWLGVLSNKNLTNLKDGEFYVIIYLVIALASGFSVFFSQFWFLCNVSIKVSRHLHNTMLKSVLRAPMSFFDSTPLGRVINRFTGDIQKLDSTLPYMLYYFVRSALNMFMCIITVLIGAPVVIIIVIPLGFIANYYRKLYIPGSRQISRMASAANSPILSHIEESVKGAPVIRAFGRVEQFINIYENRTDYWIEVNFISLNLRRWLSWRIQAMTATLSLAAALAMCWLVYFHWLSVGFVGVVMYNAFRVGVMVQQIIFGWADLEVSGVALDRVLEYIDMKKEAADEIPETKPLESWPEHGTIKFNGYSTRYSPDGQDVLKNLSFAIESKEKIGIVGRTGSGKSTLTLALFRIIEASGGEIDIDKLEIGSLGLYDLRSKLSIIPQDSQILGGTLRDNLDPFSTKTDEELWVVLEMCHLKDHFTQLETGLSTELTEGGENLSRGQAQLICLARALLRNSRVLVLDEATASVDMETDKIVQQTIRSQFKDCTIITIAHRLNTIMDSDKILVLDRGEIVEFGSPDKLLKDKGPFWKLTTSQEFST